MAGIFNRKRGRNYRILFIKAIKKILSNKGLNKTNIISQILNGLRT